MKIKTNYQIEISSSTVHRIFENALKYDPQKRGNLFQDLRMAMRIEIENILKKFDIWSDNEISFSYINLWAGKVIEQDAIIGDYNEELGPKFCAKYGTDHRSIGAINYTNGYRYLPSLLAFEMIDEFSIGNMVISVKPGNYTIQLKVPDGLKLVAYSYHISSRKLNPYLCLMGIRFPRDILRPIIQKYYKGCKCLDSDLDEIRIGTIHYPIIYICRKCGQLFTCKCFEGHFDIRDDIIRHLPYGKELEIQVKKIKTKPKLCHRCTNESPKLQYGSPMYFSSFLQRYLPYHILIAHQRYGTRIFGGEAYREIENELRERFGYPKIGEKWISETALYKIVKALFSPKEVIFHYRGSELERLELDVWIPEILLGIEYHGEQHFQAVNHWGGEEGLKKRRKNDKRKKILCKELNYHLVEFKFSKKLTTENIERRLKRFLK